jgi:hypothetical protein
MDATPILGFILALLSLALGLWYWKVTEEILLLKEIRNNVRALAKDAEYRSQRRR